MITELKKVTIYSPRDIHSKFLENLQALGVAHIIDTKKKEETPEKLQEAIDRLKFDQANVSFILGFLKSHISTKKTLRESLTHTQKILSYNQIKKNVAKLNIRKMTDTVTDIEKNLEAGRVRKKEIQQEIERTTPWKDLSVLPTPSTYTMACIGTIPLRRQEAFPSALMRQIQESELRTIHLDTQKAYIELTYLNEHESEIKKLLETHDFEAVSFNAPPRERILTLAEERGMIKRNLKKWRNYIKDFKKYIEPLEMAKEYLSWELEKLESKNKVVTTEYLTITDAWVKAKDLKLLKKSLHELSEDITLEEIDPGDDMPPIHIENNNFIKPFESVTGVYGLPKYNEVDPTPFLAPFFIVFFALCLTDAGYGLVMAVVSFLAIKIFKIPQENQKLFRLLGYGGIATFIVGALFGGWFGIDIAALNEGPVKGFIEFFKVIDPIQDTLTFMVLAFALGFFQIWFSYVIKMIVSLKNKDTGTAFSGIAWAVLILAAGMWIIGFGSSIALLTSISFYIIIISLVGLLVTESRNTKNLFVKPLVGLIGIINGSISIMSATLSYSRLMALGLSTGIIAFIFNTIAGIFRDLIPYVGWIVWLLIIVLGHVFNLGINALGAFIHSARLQFVEFFPNFMEGGGVAFSPLRRESKMFRLK